MNKEFVVKATLTSVIVLVTLFAWLAVLSSHGDDQSRALFLAICGSGLSLFHIAVMVFERRNKFY